MLIDLLINTLFDPPMGELKLILGIVGCAPPPRLGPLRQRETAARAG